MGTVTSADGTVIAYERHGEGPAVVAVDGALAHRAINPAAAQVAELLGAHFTYYTYDRRGRGGSGDTPPYSIEREIEDLDAVIEEAGGSAYVVGGSSGAVLALDAAAWGLPITRLAVYEPPFIVDGSRPPLPDDYVATLDKLVAEDRRADAVAYFMTAAVGLPEEMAAGAGATPELQAVAHTIAYDGRIMGTTMSGAPLPTDRWASITIPTLVMDGGASESYMGSGAQALTGVLRDARRRTLEGQDHGAAPEVLAPVLREFFTR